MAKSKNTTREKVLWAQFMYDGPSVSLNFSYECFFFMTTLQMPERPVNEVSQTQQAYIRTKLKLKKVNMVKEKGGFNTDEA